MKYISIFFAIFGWSLFTATAQHQISGTVKDGADGSPVPYATVVLMRSESNAAAKVITKMEGNCPKMDTTVHFWTVF